MLRGTMVRHAFTVVELLITITIMGILLTLVIVNVNSSQVSARDAERKSDIEAIAIALETYRDTDNDGGDGSFVMSGQTYPGTSYISNDTTFKQILPDLDPKLVRAPGVTVDEPKSLKVATNPTQTTGGVLPSPTPSTYVYQPLTSTNALCVNAASTECRKFNLYYMLEGDGIVYMITSKHQ